MATIGIQNISVYSSALRHRRRTRPDILGEGTLQVVNKETEVTYNKFYPTEIKKFLILSDEGQDVRVKVEMDVWKSVNKGDFVSVVYRASDSGSMRIEVVGKAVAESEVRE